MAAAAAAQRTPVPPRVARLLPWAALATLCLISAFVVLRVTGDLTFRADEWEFILHRRGITLRTFLTPHNEHPSVWPVAVYKVLLQVFGLRTYLPYQLTLLALHVTCGVLLYLYARPRLGAWLALAPAALLLFLGAAWEDIVWPFQIGYLGSVAAGLGCLLALDARPVRDWLVCALALVSLTCSSLGIAFLAVVSVEIARDCRRLHRAWVLAVPLVALAIIDLGYGTDATHRFARPSMAIRYGVDMAAAGFGAIPGLTVDYGRPLLVAGVIALVLAVRRAPETLPRVVALLCGAATYWLTTGLARSGLIVPTEGRYAYLSAALLLAIFVTALPRPRITRAAGAALAAPLVLACISSEGLFKDGTAVALGKLEGLRMGLAAMEAARDHVGPTFQPDPGDSPDINARSYFSAIDSFGSPAPSLASVRAAPEPAREAFDAGLVRALALAPRPANGPAGGTEVAPAVELAAGGALTRRAGCVRLRSAGPGARLDVTLPAGAYTLSTSAGTWVPGFLRRLGVDYPRQPSLRLPPGTRQTLTLPSDRVDGPWHLRLAPADEVSVCGA